MEPVEGARTFHATGEAYDLFMGRYSDALAPVFAATLGLATGQRVLDIGCGPGALTGALVDLLGADAVAACDPSPPFVEACAVRHPGVDVRAGRAESLPYDDAVFDVAAAQLVLHFVTDPAAAVTEGRRVVRPGGTIGACVWDFHDEMEMLRAFWDAAAAIDPDALDEARTLRFGRPGEIAELFAAGGLEDIVETNLRVESSYSGFDELWAGFLAGIGPAGAFCVGLPDDARAEFREALLTRLGRPAGSFTLRATARSATATTPE